MNVSSEELGSRLVFAPDAAKEAAKYAVPADIHEDDFIFDYHLAIQSDPTTPEARAEVTRYYFADGDRSASTLDRLVREYQPIPDGTRLAMLDFASGYGCVARHISKMRDRYDLTACDIHEKAIKFLRSNLGINAVLSHRDPAEFRTPHKFDAILALSFFSHMPDRTFGHWLRALIGTLAENGILVFTTHGRNAYDQLNHPPLDPAGVWFTPVSEQRDLPVEDYGATIVTPQYVIWQLGYMENTSLISFREAFWWGTQDVYIVRKTGSDFRPPLCKDGLTFLPRGAAGT